MRQLFGHIEPAVARVCAQKDMLEIASGVASPRRLVPAVRNNTRKRIGARISTWYTSEALCTACTAPLEVDVQHQLELGIQREDAAWRAQIWRVSHPYLEL